MEGFVFQFPDFDDPRLNDGRVNFENPGAFYDEFCRRFPRHMERGVVGICVDARTLEIGSAAGADV